MGRKSRTLSLRGRIAVVARNSAITAILAIATRQKHCGSRRAGGCAEHHILANVITQAQDVFGNVLLSIICNRSMSAGQRQRGDSRTGCSEKTALQRLPKATFVKTIVLGYLHLPCPVLGTCRLVVLVVIGHRLKPKMAITLRKVPVQNGDRLPPDAALRLARRKRGNSLPRPQSASGLSSSDLERSVRVLA